MNMIYEGFIRRAFGIDLDNGIVDRWGDPAGLANTDVFNSGSISSVKAATSYSMEIFNDRIKENRFEDITDTVSQQMDEYVERVINAQDKQEISDLIESYVENIEDRYWRDR